MRVDFLCYTDGKGYWSKKKALVRCIDLSVPYNNENEFGELRVKFDLSTWDVTNDGLIYTDELFMSYLRNNLYVFLGAAADDVSYSEHGMQDKDYVSCDVGATFLKAWNAFTNNEVSVTGDEL
jgi:hypothetical protein